MKAEQIERVAGIIADKHWSVFDLLAHPSKTTHDAIIDMLKDLPASEVDLTLDFLDDYRIVKDYSKFARDLMVRIKERVGNESVIVSPVVDYNSDRTKSGHALHYEMSNFTSLFLERQIEFIDDPRSERCQSHDGFHYSVDDYIGTGTQFLTMRDAVQGAGKSFNVTDIGVLCIQREAKETLEAKGFRVEGLDVRGKAIEQLAERRGVKVEELYAEYEALERKTKCAKKYKLGRDKAEALVTMKATPNNTLPIFWIEGSRKWPAPFPRPRR